MGNIHQQIIACMGDITPIAKSRENDQQGYKFRGIDDIYNALAPLLAKHCIYAYPQVVSEKREERQTRSGSNLIYTVLTVKYTFVTTDGSFIEVTVIGEGMDSGDKSSNKAMSAAQKYAFLQVFSIPTADAKDSENESHEVKKRESGKRETKKRETGEPAATGSAHPAPQPPPARESKIVTNAKAAVDAAMFIPDLNAILAKADGYRVENKITEGQFDEIKKIVEQKRSLLETAQQASKEQ